jgi:hypothetical protein
MVNYLSNICLLTSHWHGLGGEPPDFYGCDTRAQYLENLVRQPPDWPWRSKPVHYTINSQGYRAGEFDDLAWSDSIVFFGCSYVFAPGVDDSETMPSVLGQRTGINVINLGQGATDQLFQWINSVRLAAAGVRPRAVIYLWPGTQRISELITRESVANWGSWNASSDVWAGSQITREPHITNLLEYYSQSVRLIWSCPVLEYYPYLFNTSDGGREINQGGLPGRKLDSTQWSTIRPWGHVIDAARDVGARGNYHPGPQTLSNWVDQFLIRDLRSHGLI